MRLWLRLTLAIGALAVAPVLVVGAQAVRVSSSGALIRSEESLNREASSLATFVGAWSDAIAASLDGWSRVWELEGRSPEYQIGLLRAVYTALDPVVTVALVDAAGRPVVEPQFLGREDVGAGREAGSAERAALLLKRLPAPAAGVAFGLPYLPPGAVAPVVPMVASTQGSTLRLAAEVSLAAVSGAFPKDEERASALFAGGEAVIGASPLLGGEQLRDVVELGLDLSFAPVDGAGELRGAAVRVPGTSWLVVVAEEAARAERAGAVIRGRTMWTIGAALVAVGLMALVLQQQITLPLGRLRAGVARVAQGSYGARIELPRRDEIGELASDLNHMSEALQRSAAAIAAQRAEIEAFNRELQDRVEARTAELQATQGRLVRAAQYAAIAEVGAGLAHELNNPLAAILGLAQLLQARGHGDVAALGRIEGQAQRCREVVETMVRFAQGDLDPARAPVIDLTRIARESVDVIAPAYAQRGIELSLDLPSMPVHARVEPGLAEQVLIRWLDVFRVGLSEGAHLRVSVREGAEGPVVRLTPDHAIALDTEGDDWRAGGVQLWVARRLIDRTGGQVREPGSGDSARQLLLPAA